VEGPSHIPADTDIVCCCLPAAVWPQWTRRCLHKCCDWGRPVNNQGTAAEAVRCGAAKVGTMLLWWQGLRHQMSWGSASCACAGCREQQWKHVLHASVWNGWRGLSAYASRLIGLCTCFVQTHCGVSCRVLLSCSRQAAAQVSNFSMSHRLSMPWVHAP